MKHNNHTHHQDQTRQPADAARSISAAAMTPAESNYTPAPDEVARKAYFTYVNEGSQDGHEVQHWLQAEAQLIAERRLTRSHAFPNRT
jgi:hypothetical protein